MPRFVVPVVALCLLAVSIAHADTIGLPPPIVPQGFGVNIHFRTPSPTELARFGEAGYGLARMDFHWATVEKTAGVYDFSQYDTLTSALDSVHCRPLYILDYANPLYDEGLAPHTDAGRAAFAKFAAAAAEHFKGRGVIWEIWNEPNGAGFWRPSPSPEDYAQLAIVTAKAIRTADPKSTIIAPGLAGTGIPYLKTVFRSGLLDYIDAVSVHPYRRSAPETALGEYRAIRSLIAACTVPGKPQVALVASEWGYSSVDSWKVDEATQARYLLREWLVNLAAGINLTIYYDWRDDGLDPKDQEHHFGTLHNDLSDKPAFVAAKQLIQSLNGYQFVRRVDPPAGDNDDWTLVFRKDNTMAMVTWNASLTAPADQQMPTVKFVEPANPWHKTAFRLAEVDATSGPVVATALDPANASYTVTNREAEPARVVVNVGGQRRTATIAPGASSSFAFELSASRIGPATRAVPVTVTWNDRLVEGIGPVEVVTADLIDVSVDPLPGKLIIHTETFGSPFRGKLIFDIGDRQKGIPVDLSAYSTSTITVPCDIEEPIMVRAEESKHKVAFRSKEYTFRRAFDAGKSLGGSLPYDIVPYPNNVAGSAVPAKSVAAGDGAPAPVAISMPFQTSQAWLYTELKPLRTMTIPRGATELVVWMKSPGDRAGIRARLLDSTGQTFQPAAGQFDWDGWKAVHLPLTGQISSWGGANDGKMHAPLTWDALLLIDGTHIIDSSAECLIGPAFYTMP